MNARVLLTAAGALLALASAHDDPPADKKADPAQYEARLAAAKAITDPLNQATTLVKIATEAAEDDQDEVVKKAMSALPKSIMVPDSDNDYLTQLKKLAATGRDAEALEAAKIIAAGISHDYVLGQLAEGDKTGPLAFWRACEAGKDDRLVALLSTVSVNAKDKAGETGLMKAAANGHVAVVKKLLATAKIELWETDAKGQTALMKAAANGQDAVVRLILMYYQQANYKVYPKDDPVNLADAKGQTALMLAAAKGNVSVVQTLLDIRREQIQTFSLAFEGAGKYLVDEARKDNDGKTAQDLAEAAQHTGAADLLKNARKKAG